MIRDSLNDYFISTIKGCVPRISNQLSSRCGMVDLRYPITFSKLPCFHFTFELRVEHLAAFQVTLKSNELESVRNEESVQSHSSLCIVDRAVRGTPSLNMCLSFSDVIFIS